MNAPRFTAIATALASAATRRRVIRGVAGAAAGWAAARAASLGAQTATPESTPGEPIEVRKNAKELSAAEREAFVDAILGTKKKPSPWIPGISVYDTFVVWHRDAFGCAEMAAHMGPAFPPWHRAFVRMFEQELQAIEPAVTIPYWDWTVDQAPDAYLWQDDFMGGNGDPSQNYAVTSGPFAKGKWQITVFDYGDDQLTPSIVRDFGAGRFAPTLPTVDEVEAALSIPVYDAPPWNSTIPPGRSFRNALEGWQDCVAERCDVVDGMAPTCTGPHNLHNRVHLWVAGEFELASQGGQDVAPDGTPIAPTPGAGLDLFGTMAFNTSLNDPVFWLHHANIDRLWNEWMRRHGPVYAPESGGPIGHNLDDPMWPYSLLGMMITPRMMLSSRDLSYVYDTDE